MRAYAIRALASTNADLVHGVCRTLPRLPARFFAASIALPQLAVFTAPSAIGSLEGCELDRPLRQIRTFAAGPSLFGADLQLLASIINILSIHSNK